MATRMERPGHERQHTKSSIGSKHERKLSETSSEKRRFTSTTKANPNAAMEEAQPGKIPGRVCALPKVRIANRIQLPLRLRSPLFSLFVRSDTLIPMAIQSVFARIELYSRISTHLRQPNPTFRTPLAHDGSDRSTLYARLRRLSTTNIGAERRQ